ncbi:hypothetical protein OH799_33435 [Nocardia sp. NBC_00881]|uniref:hypothetical protein n=1 Tax=Nocardia sp. NBC_00881 TaxID=2975995 RepID=UPI00386620A1|nr:hypothetical protein OH799_33435 [Nocardia sp. NBC_00881]
MGASSWDYFVPYQPDLNAALDALRRKVFADRDYLWPPGTVVGSDESQVISPPSTMAEILDDEWFWEVGTHSILDMLRVVGENDSPDHRDVRPVRLDEAVRRTGTDLLTRDHVEIIQDLAEERWIGRCAVLYDLHGRPTEIYFWGFSGD